MASAYQTRLIKQYKAEGYLTLKAIRLNENGFPDLWLLKDGVLIIREVKEGADDISPLQRRRIDQLIAQGFDAACIHETKGIIYPLPK